MSLTYFGRHVLPQNQNVYKLRRYTTDNKIHDYNHGVSIKLDTTLDRREVEELVSLLQNYLDDGYIHG